MSGSYVNMTHFGGREKQRPAAPPEPNHDTPFSMSTTSASSSVVADRGRQSSVRCRPKNRGSRKQQQRHRSILSQRSSQVYEQAMEGKPACLHRAAVSPALWLLCQVVLVVLFALCCVFLTNSSLGSSTAVSHKEKVWMRLQFDLDEMRQHACNLTGAGDEVKIQGDKPFGHLICSSGQKTHCHRMKKYFELSDPSNEETTIKIKHGAVYRINAAVTFPSEPVGFQADVSIMIDRDVWITCQEGVTARDVYVHCALFGIRYLPANSFVSFKSNMGRRVAGNNASTFFEIEMR